MNRAQFMEQLSRLLSDISESERMEALDYYNSYFDDAGEENEAAVIRELGSPGKVAAIIKADLKESNETYSQYTEWGYEDTRVKDEKQMPDQYGNPKSEKNHQEKKEQRTRNRSEKGYHAEKKKNNAGVILVLILLVFLAPFLSGAVGGILGIVITIALLPFIAIFVFGVCAVAFLISGIACGVAGIAICIGNPPAGVLTMGIGCFMTAAAILFLLALVWTAGWMLPKLLNKFTVLCHNVLQRERKDGKRA